SWLHMLASGSTITTEAWDVKFKPNEDWTHAWAAAPANIIPRSVLGVRPLTPGFEKILIAPHVGSLVHVEGTIPTIRGNVHIKLDAPKKHLEVEIPANTTARIILPWTKNDPEEIGARTHVFDDNR